MKIIEEKFGILVYPVYLAITMKDRKYTSSKIFEESRDELRAISFYTREEYAVILERLIRKEYEKVMKKQKTVK